MSRNTSEQSAQWFQQLVSTDITRFKKKKNTIYTLYQLISSVNGVYKLCRQKLPSSFSVWAVVSLLLLLRCSSKSTIPHQRPESTLQFKTCPPITALYGSNSPRWHLHNKRDDKLIHWHPSLSSSPPSHSPHSPTLLGSPSPVTPPLLLLCQDPKSPSTALTLLPSPLISSCPSGWSATAPTLTAPRPNGVRCDVASFTDLPPLLRNKWSMTPAESLYVKTATWASAITITIEQVAYVQVRAQVPYWNKRSSKNCSLLPYGTFALISNDRI